MSGFAFMWRWKNTDKRWSEESTLFGLFHLLDPTMAAGIPKALLDEHLWNGVVEIMGVYAAQRIVREGSQ